MWHDKHKVMQILVNLVANAKYAMDTMPEQQRHLLVRLTMDDGWARIQVTDSGVGLAPEILGKLFTHGFTTRKDGHGFGLHSSALAAKMLGGRLTLESEGPGKGTTATLEIPLMPEPRKSPPRPGGRSPSWVPLHPRRVLDWFVVGVEIEEAHRATWSSARFSRHCREAWEPPRPCKAAVIVAASPRTTFT